MQKSGYARPVINAEADFAAANPGVVKTLPFAAPFVSPEAEYLARVKAAEMKPAAPKQG